MRKPNPIPLNSAATQVELSPNGLKINGTLAIRQIGPFYLPLVVHPQRDDESARRLFRIGRLMSDGDIYIAIIHASTTRWSNLDEMIGLLAKANFNPFEARDYRGWWARDDTSPTGADATVTEIGYNGFLHDAVVDDLIGAFRRAGATAEKNITVVGLPGVPSIPDIIALPVGATLPIVIEVKTGANPPYTNNQQYVYPLICVGGHVTSADPRLPSLGLSIGKPFPRLDVYELYTSGFRQPLHPDDICKFLGLRP